MTSTAVSTSSVISTSGTASTTGTVTAVHNGTPPAGALTTIFTPAAHCYEADSLDLPESCYPPNWESYSTDFYYSPGICPSGMTSAGNPASPGSLMGPPLEMTETGIYCCTESYTLIADATMKNGWTGIICETFSGASGGAYHTAIQVRWAETDLDVLETSPVTEDSSNSTATKTAGTLSGSLIRPTTTGRGSLINPTSTETGSADATSSGNGGSGAGVVRGTNLAGVILGCMITIALAV